MTTNNIEKRENDVKVCVELANDLHNQMMENSFEFSILQDRADRLWSRYNELLTAFENNLVSYMFSRPFRWGASRTLQDRQMRKDIRAFQNSLSNLEDKVRECRTEMSQVAYNMSRASIKAYGISRKLRSFCKECSEDERGIVVRMASFLDSEVKRFERNSSMKESETGMMELEAKILGLSNELFNEYSLKSVVNKFEVVKHKFLI